jgi:hypothetical protein
MVAVPVQAGIHFSAGTGQRSSRLGENQVMFRCLRHRGSRPAPG